MDRQGPAVSARGTGRGARGTGHGARLGSDDILYRVYYGCRQVRYHGHIQTRAQSDADADAVAIHRDRRAAGGWARRGAAPGASREVDAVRACVRGRARGGPWACWMPRCPARGAPDAAREPMKTLRGGCERGPRRSERGVRES